MADGRCRWISPPMADGPMAGSPMPMADADGLKSLLSNLIIYSDVELCGMLLL